MCQKVGLNEPDAPLFVIATMGSSGTWESSDQTGYDYYLQIEEHGLEAWGDQSKILYDLKGFYSKIFDVSFNHDCSIAVAFMYSIINSSSAVETVMMKLDI